MRYVRLAKRRNELMNDMDDVDVQALAEQLGVHLRKIEMLLLMQKMTRVILDPEVPSDQVRKRIFQEVPREQLQQAVDELRGGLLDDEERAEIEAELRDSDSDL